MNSNTLRLYFERYWGAVYVIKTCLKHLSNVVTKIKWIMIFYNDSLDERLSVKLKRDSHNAAKYLLDKNAIVFLSRSWTMRKTERISCVA